MWFVKFAILIIPLTCAKGLHLPSDDCVIPFGSKTQWDTFWPLVYNDQGDLLATSLVDDVESVVVSNGQSVLVSCGPNYLKKRVPNQFVNAMCLNDGKFQVTNEQEVNRAKDFGCDLRSVQEVLTAVNGCPSDKKAVKFGLVNPVDQKAYMIGEACYSESAGKLLFAHIRKGNLKSYNLEVANNKIFKELAPSSRYKVDFMKAFRLDEFNDRLKHILKIKNIPSFNMVNFVDDTFLSNRQLYSVKKLAWNYLIVHEPLTNYELLKQDIADLEGNVDIYTGSHGVAAVEGKDIYLDLEDNRFPVPALIWVVVKKGNDQIGFIVYNDPSVNGEMLEDSSLCNSKCNSVSWLKRLKKNSQYSVTRDGLVLCCDVNEIAKAIPEYPNVE